MKQRLILIGALLLLFAIIGFMVSDLFFTKEANEPNPYDYRLDSLKKTDSALNDYTEVLTLSTHLDKVTAVSTDGTNIYLAGRNGIEISDGHGEFHKLINLEGTPNCITLDGQKNIWLGMLDHVEMLDQQGKPIKKWTPVDPRSFITSIAIGGNNVFVADAGRKVVYRYSLDGKLLNHIGEKDPERRIPGFVIPSPYFDLCIGKNGSLWVVNPGRHTIENFDTEGHLITSWGIASMAVEGFSGCCNPTHIAMLSDGSFVTSEKGIERVKRYSPSGSLISLIAAPDLFDEGTRGLDLAVDRQDRILVLDPFRKEVRIFVQRNHGGSP